VLTTDLTIGQGTSSGILAVADPASTVFIAGGMTVGSSGIYIHGNGTLTFNAGGGTVSINPNNAALYNLNFTGAATFLINGATLDIDIRYQYCRYGNTGWGCTNYKGRNI